DSRSTETWKSSESLADQVAAAEEHKYPHRLRTMAALVKLVVFDLENTLIFNEFLPELAAIVGKEAEVAAITRAGIDGQIDWENGFRARAERLGDLTQALVLRASRSLPRFVRARDFVDC